MDNKKAPALGADNSQLINSTSSAMISDSSKEKMWKTAKKHLSSSIKFLNKNGKNRRRKEPVRETPTSIHSKIVDKRTPKRVTFRTPIDDAQRMGIGWKDFAVISALWNFQVLFSAFENWKSLIYLDKSIATYWLGKEEVKLLDESVDMVVFICIGMLAVGAIASFCHSNNYALLLLGLVIFTIGPIFLELSVTGGSSTLGCAGILCQVGWYMANPLRYWLIFHQKFPLPLSQSHQLTTFVECIIFICRYVSAVCIYKLHSPSVGRLEYDLGFILAIIICWALIILALYPWRNKVPNDFAAIRRVYERSEVLEGFENRGSREHILLFQSLLCSFVMFAVTKEAILLGLKESSNLVHQNFTFYRPDLACAIVSIIGIEIMFSLFYKIRNETSDLIIIALAHVITIVVLAMLIFAEAPTREKRENSQTFKSLIEKPILCASMCLFGVAEGASVVSSNHFIWVQAPFRFRALMLAGYLSMSHLLSWTSRTYISKFALVQVSCVLFIQIVVTLWHCSVTFVFATRLRKQLSDLEGEMRDRRV